MGGIIDTVEPGSIAEQLDWQPGDQIISINGHILSDLIDYRFYCADEHLSVLVRRGDESAEFEVEKDYETDLGVTFRDALFDGVRTCGARCIFCFVEQLPRGLRKSLYLKDDDFRLSFLHGNYVTLANVTEEDLLRIVTQRLSPLYISVHTTNPDLRERMLGREAPAILEQIDELAKGNITLHTQIVLCRGINDGSYLDATVQDLAARYPTVRSIAIVPVGLTAHRRNKTPIGPTDAQYSAEILDKVRRWQRRFLAEKGTRLVWAADEFYLNAGRPVPSARAYEGYPQIENGVGLVRQFRDSAYRTRRRLLPLLQEKPGSERPPLRISIVTGQLAARVIRDWAESISSDALQVEVYAIPNRLFGESVTVAGLIPGNDIIEHLEGRDLGDVLIIPAVSLRDGAFLDDVTLDDISRRLGVRVIAVPPTPVGLLRETIRVIKGRG